MTPFDTNRWVGVDGAALLVGAAGVLARRPALLLASVVGLAALAAARIDEAPAPTLDVERTLSDDAPDPGDEVTVTVRVRNVGDRALPDLRLVDGVPPALSAEDPARLGTALRPGAGATVSYRITAVRGEHNWEPLVAISRGATGSRERTAEIDADTTMQCSPELSATADLPLRGLTTQFSGRVGTDVPGAGLEFYATREYRRGDPVSRIDWNRYARTGSLSTVQFRQERAASVVLLVDAREAAYVAPEQGVPNAVERGVDAATGAFTALLESGDQVGIAALAPTECWLPPGAGAAHRARARDLFATHPALAPTPGDGRYYASVELRRLRNRLPADAQVLVFSPLVDDYAAKVARRIDAYGHLVTVVSPDPTVESTPGRRLARIERENRISRLRRAGVRVIDWAEGAIDPEIERASARWSG